MSREKQIEEMARSLCLLKNDTCEDCNTINKKKVIKCKNCKHRYEPTQCALWYGTADGKEYFLERGENFSCPWGERRTKDEKTIS